MSRLGSILLVLAAVVVLAASCGGDDPANPGGGTTAYLAGGGRQANDDAFVGGPGGSGPGRPDFEPPSADFSPLFYADLDCREDSSAFVITNGDDWQAWWTEAIACLGPRDPGKADPDSGVVYPDTIYNPYPDEAPPVDFATATVFVVALGPDDVYGRSVWIQGVTDDQVDYVVSHLGEDCFEGPRPMDAGPSSPTTAVVGPLVTAPDQLTWLREDVTYDCSWEPDPSEPLALYYTDAACDLGAEHAVITDAETFASWLATAFACDQARWSGPGGVPVPEDSTGTQPPMPSPGWLGLQVDFTTHAVIVLRGDEQERWGGGVWLAAITADAGGTTIDYAVMAAGENCPLAENGTTVQPTVAIRVPLPLAEPITWRRASETIDCDWDGDGGPVGGGGVDSTVVEPPPR
jgi:hypothetical protein